MARKSVKTQSSIDASEEKRILIDSLELLRGNSETKSKAGRNREELNYSSQTTLPNKEVYSLRKEVKRLQSANILLESDITQMEQKALDAIAESGRMRQLLDKARDNTSANETRYYAEERQAILEELRHSRYTHSMLTQAITESENEITRLTKTIEKITLKLLVA